MTEFPPNVPTKTISITMPREQAEALSLSLADLLCWLNGWQAAREGIGCADNDPMGVEAVRTMNINLKDALS